MFALRLVADLQVISVVRHLRAWAQSLSGAVLEVGCGAQPYRHLLPASCAYQGLEWTESKRYFSYEPPDTAYYDGGAFPFQEGAFDWLFSTEVLEHIYDTVPFLAECHRVLRPGGGLLLTVPFQARYHYIPIDFWRFTPAALDRRFSEAGFVDIRILPRGNDITVAAHKSLSVIYRWLSAGGFARILGVIASPLALLLLAVGHLSLKLRIGSQDDCLGYTVIARRGPRP